MSKDKSGSPPCGIYVRIDDFSNMLDLIGYVRQMAFAINRGSGYEKNFTVVELVCDENDQERQERITDLIAVIRDQGLVAVVSGLNDISNIKGSDGVLIKQADDIESVRKHHGIDVIIGVEADNQKDAKEAISAGCDYIVTGADPTVIAGISHGTECLIVARGEDITNQNCGVLAQAGASFVDVSDYVLGYEKGVMQATVNVLDALEQAMQVPEALN